MRPIIAAAKEYFGDKPFTVINEGQAIWDGNGDPISEPDLGYIKARSDELAISLRLIEIENEFSTAIQAHLDAAARQRRYDGIQTAITYRTDPNPQFAAEGEALFVWRSEVWTYSTVELDKVKAGERDIPTVGEFIAELPAFEWPEAGL